jgi:hypothetical protein
MQISNTGKPRTEELKKRGRRVLPRTLSARACPSETRGEGRDDPASLLAKNHPAIDRELRPIGIARRDLAEHRWSSRLRGNWAAPFFAFVIAGCSSSSSSPSTPGTTPVDASTALDGGASGEGAGAASMSDASVDTIAVTPEGGDENLAAEGGEGGVDAAQGVDTPDAAIGDADATPGDSDASADENSSVLDATPGASEAAAAPMITTCVPDGGPVDAGTCGGSSLITLTTTGAWAAWQDGDGAWTELPSGIRTFTPTGCRYGVAVECPAVPSCEGPSISVNYRTTATTSVTVSCPTGCTGSGSAFCNNFASKVSGTLSNVGDAGWLVTNQYGQGLAITTDGGSAFYTLSNPNGRDLAMGLASAPGQPFTQLAVMRGALMADASFNPVTVNVDFATQGFVPATKAFAVGGLGPADIETHSIEWVMAQPPPPACPNPPLAVSPAGTNTYQAIDSAHAKPGDAYLFASSAESVGEPVGFG